MVWLRVRAAAATSVWPGAPRNTPKPKVGWLAGEPAAQAADHARGAGKLAATPLGKALARWFAARS